MTKNILISLVVIMIVGLAAWTTLPHSAKNRLATTQAALLPDAFMEDINAIVMNKEGKIHMKIVAPKMIHYAENDLTQLSTPQLTLYRNSPKPWYINSKYAQATMGIELVHFWDNVTIHHAADQNNPATLIKTSKLLVHPNKQTAETNEFITLTQPSLVVQATGMFADLNTGNIKLLSKARGEYVPN